MMRWPGHIPAGLVYREAVSSIDILPTILSAAAGKIPPGRDGVDLLSYLDQKQQSPPHNELYWKYGDHSAIRQGDWKLLSTSAKSPAMLFNLANDQMENNDLSNDEPARRDALLNLLTQWKSHLPPPLSPLYVPKHGK
jgi:arylsulfatase A-like enzyme